MQNIVINNQPISLQALMSDIRSCVEKGFKGFGTFTPEAVLEMVQIMETSVGDKDVPKDYLQPNWMGKNRIYEWKNYIANEQQAMWETFSDRQKSIFAKEANKKAMMESWE